VYDYVVYFRCVIQDNMKGATPAEDLLELMLGHELAQVGDEQRGAGGVVHPDPRL
jgi:hypothetical protein